MHAFHTMCCHASSFGMTITGRRINIIFIWWANLLVLLTTRPHRHGPSPSCTIGIDIISYLPLFGITRHYVIMPSAVRRRQHFYWTCSAWIFDTHDISYLLSLRYPTSTLCHLHRIHYIIYLVVACHAHDWDAIYRVTCMWLRWWYPHNMLPGSAANAIMERVTTLFALELRVNIQSILILILWCLGNTVPGFIIAVLTPP